MSIGHKLFVRAPAILLALLVSFAALPPPSQAAQITQFYCIKGTSDNQGWSWRVTRDDASFDQANCNALPNGADAEALTISFCNCVDGEAGTSSQFVGGADLATKMCGAGWEAAFSITTENPSFELDVDVFGSSNPATTGCNVQQGSTCNFNPDITQGNPPPVPTLAEWGRVALVLLLLGTGSALIFRRRVPKAHGTA